MLEIYACTKMLKVDTFAGRWKWRWERERDENGIGDRDGGGDEVGASYVRIIVAVEVVKRNVKAAKG